MRWPKPPLVRKGAGLLQEGWQRGAWQGVVTRGVATRSVTTTALEVLLCLLCFANGHCLHCFLKRFAFRQNTCILASQRRFDIRALWLSDLRVWRLFYLCCVLAFLQSSLKCFLILSDLCQSKKLLRWLDRYSLVGSWVSGLRYLRFFYYLAVFLKS